MLLTLLSAVGAFGIPVRFTFSIVLFVKVSVPAKVAMVPVVGKVIFVAPVLVNVVLKLPAVVKAFAVKILPPKVIVLPELFTPVPPYCPAIAEVNSELPSKGLPYIFIGVASFVVVLALPAKAAVIVPALKLPSPSLLTNVFAVLFEVAAAIASEIVLIVEELTPPILFEEADILETTNAVVAICVLLAASSGADAVGIPVNDGDRIVLFVNVSVPANVAIVPVVGKVIFVSPVLVNVVLKLPAVVKSLAVKIFPPKVMVLPKLFTPVPPYCPAIAEVNAKVPSKGLPYIPIGAASFVDVLALPDKVAVIVPALKLPLGSLLTNVLTVFVAVAALIVVFIVAIVEEFTPPTLFTVGKSAVPPKSLANFMIPLSVAVAPFAELDIIDLTKAAVATSVPLASAAGLLAVGLPVNDGDEIVGETIVLFVKVSVPVKVAIVPVVGSVI